jgi:hypothetical protein
MYWFFQLKHTLFSVRSELNSICRVEYSSFHSGCTIAEAVSRRPLTAETRVRSRVSRCDKVKLGQFFSEHFGFPLSVSFHQCSILISSYMLSLPAGQTGKCWELPKKQCAFGNRGPLDRKAVSFFCLKVLVSDTAPGLGVPVPAAPRRAPSVFRPVPSQGLAPSFLGLHLPAPPSPSTAPLWERCHRPFVL